MTRNLGSRIDRVEQRLGDDDGRCPHCPTVKILARQVGELPGTPSRCGRCGRPGRCLRLVYVVVPAHNHSRA